MEDVECGSKCVCKSEFFGDANDKKRVEGVSVLPLSLSIIGRLLVVLFMLDPPQHTHTHIIHMCELLSIHIHSFIHTQSHVT